jgi:flavin reductase (DIM6/NTAB) family NADH-FMN oxidoreductase RutF
MKKILCFIVFNIFLAACGSQNESNYLKDKQLAELFKNIPAAEFGGNVFKLVGEDNMVITSGDESDYNSMTAGWGGWGIFFNEPTTWGMLRANRHTLKYIRKNKTYTLSFFNPGYRDQLTLFGSLSGSNSDKMKKHALTPVLMPNGSVAYKEAKLIIECDLSEITTVNPADFYTDSMKKFVGDAYAETKDYHKLVFGKITGLWIKK